VLKLTNITKAFGVKTVLNNINIEIKEGEIYGLIGANGAGKTTLMNIISQLLAPTGGQVEINGKVIRCLNDLKGLVGYMLDIPPMHDYLTAKEYFEFLSAAQKISKEELDKMTPRLLGQVGLRNIDGMRIKTFSRGMRQRLGIAAGLITNPDIVLMDEPSSALDPQGRLEVVEIIRQLSRQGKTIILSTHILSDVEKICTQIGLLHKGHLVVEGTLREVLNKFQENIYIVECDKKDFKQVEDCARKSSFFDRAKEDDNGVHVWFKEGGKKDMFNALAKIKADISGIYLKPTTVEEIFLKADELMPKQNEAEKLVEEIINEKK